MGVLYKGVCLPSSVEAKAQFCSDSSQIWYSGTDVYTSSCASSNPLLATFPLCVSTNGGACTIRTTKYPDFIPCDHAAVSDLGTEWFGIALGFLIIVWAVKKLLQQFDHSQSGT